MIHRDDRPAADPGVVTPVELMYVLVGCVVALLFLGYLGRLHAAGIQVTNTSQAAARAASIAADPVEARAVAQQIVAESTLATRCASAPVTSLAWQPSPTGEWRGGAVTVTVSCTVRNQALSGVWSPGSRTLSAADTQPIDRYRR
jgi:Flp pilus assembly protein TadG